MGIELSAQLVDALYFFGQLAVDLIMRGLGLVSGVTSVSLSPVNNRGTDHSRHSRENKRPQSKGLAS